MLNIPKKGLYLHIITMCWCVHKQSRHLIPLTEPGGSFPCPLHYSLVFVLVARLLSLIEDNRLGGRSLQWASLHGLDLNADESRFSAHLLVTEPAQDMLLLQVATLQTRLNIVLGAE